MTTEAKVQLTSTELGTLWNTYLIVSGRSLIFKFFEDTTVDNEAKNILASFNTELKQVKDKITVIFTSEGAVIPTAFNEQDIIKDAPPLYDDIFHIMFLRQMMKLNFGLDAVFTAISFEKEVQDVFNLHYDISRKYYRITTDYLLRKGVLAKPPRVTMPTQVEFVEDKSYMSGFNILSDKRTLNTIEVGYIFEALETTAFLMKLLTGFVQVAKEDDVREYFTEGIKLTKKNIDKISDVLMQSNIEPSLSRGGKATDSTISPFSDKLMMYMTSLLTTTPLSYSALGTSFSFRSDLPILLALLAKDLFFYSKESGKLMIKHKWMEEPPQMEDRNQLTKSEK